MLLYCGGVREIAIDNIYSVLKNNEAAFISLYLKILPI